MTLRSLPIAALILSACNSGTVTAQQANQAAPGNAAAPAPQSTTNAAASQDGVCSFSGWSSDPDPRGLNVRAEPSATARIVGTLPPPERGEDIEVDFGATFDVVGSRDGWFLIQNARRWSQQGGPSTLPSGWISGRYLTFQLMTDKAFAAPDPSAPVVVTSFQEDGGLSQFRYRHPTACRGEWVRLRVAGRDGREREGWVRGICGIQETTCDGVRGDLLENDPARGWRTMD